MSVAAGLVQQLVQRNDVSMDQLHGVGVGTCGHVDYESGRIIASSNLDGFHNYPLRDKLQEQLQVKVRIDNDANAQAWGEYVFGAGYGRPNMVFVTVSTGIGAGIIIDGRIHRGADGTAGEIGHTIVNPFSTVRCGCGNYGCLMSHAAGISLPQVVRQKLYQGGYTSTFCSVDLEDNEINGELIKKGLDAGDPLCVDIVFEYAEYLGIGLYNLFQTYDPELIVLGGGLTAWGDIYFNRIKEKFYVLARDMMRRRIEIIPAHNGYASCLIGAASLLI